MNPGLPMPKPMLTCSAILLPHGVINAWIAGPCLAHPTHACLTERVSIRGEEGEGGERNMDGEHNLC